jgi:hypothetical protein
MMTVARQEQGTIEIDVIDGAGKEAGGRDS